MCDGGGRGVSAIVCLSSATGDSGRHASLVVNLEVGLVELTQNIRCLATKTGQFFLYIETIITST